MMKNYLERCLMTNKQGKLDLQKFVIDFFREIGAVVEVKSFAFVEILIPEEYIVYFNDEIIYIAFDPEVAEEEGVPFITIGSPFLEKILDFILNKQFVIKRDITFNHLSLPDNAINIIKDKYYFNKCRLPEIRDSLIEEHHFLSFIFQLSITADERENMLRTVTIDLYKNRSVSEMGKALQGAFFSNGKSGIYPLPPLVSVNEACQTAKKSILELADEEKKNFEKRVQKYRDEELDQLKDFYDKTENELKNHLEREELRVDVDSEKQQKKIDRLAQKIEANQLDRQRRFQDIIDKYTSDVEIKLSSLIYYTMPKIKVFLSIQQKQKFHELELLYNPLLYKFEDPICPLCNKKFQIIYFINQEAVCSECAKRFSKAGTD